MRTAVGGSQMPDVQSVFQPCLELEPRQLLAVDRGWSWRLSGFPLPWIMSVFRKEDDPRADYSALLPPPGSRRAETALKATFATWWAVGLSFASVASALWSCWSWWPSVSAPVEIAMPPLMFASAAAFPHELTLGPGDRPDRRSSLCFGLFAAMLGLAMGAWRDFRQLVVDETLVGPCAAALLGGGLIALLASRIDRRQMGDALMLVFAGGAGVLWAAGLLLEANAHFPERGTIQTTVEVVDKQVWTGGRGGKTYKLWLRADAAIPPAAMTVRQPLYERTPVGARLCVIRTTGALKVRWWEVAECRSPSVAR